MSALIDRTTVVRLARLDLINSMPEILDLMMSSSENTKSSFAKREGGVVGSGVGGGAAEGRRFFNISSWIKDSIV